MTIRLPITLAAAIVLTACGSGSVTDPVGDGTTPAQVENGGTATLRQMWITKASCGPQNQAPGTFKPGDVVYLNGSGYRDGVYGWSILGAEFGQSTDQGVTVARGTIRFAEGLVKVIWTTGTPGAVVGGSGSFCFAAYTIPQDDLGKYYGFVGGVKDSYMVEAATGTVTVTETATATATRVYQWSMQLSADHQTIEMNPSERHQVYYTLRLTYRQGATEYGVGGIISIRNPGTVSVVVHGVGNVVSSPAGTTSTVTCPALPVTLAPAATLTCTHQALVSGPASGNSRATVAISDVGGAGSKAIQSNAVPYGMNGVEERVRGEHVRVTDDRYGLVGNASAHAEATTTFNYSLMIQALHETEPDCGTNPFRNTATFTAEDGSVSGKSDWTVMVTIRCPIDCNRTADYWKTHSKYGPQPYDKTWAAVGEDHAFFLTGKTWYQMFLLPVEGTDRYVALAHQFMAAFLNHLAHGNDAVPAAALADATTLLQTYQLGTVPSHAWAQFDAVTATLRSYNEGRLGVGACQAAN